MSVLLPLQTVPQSKFMYPSFPIHITHPSDQFPLEIMGQRTHTLLILMAVDKLPIVKVAPFYAPGYPLTSVCYQVLGLGHSRK